MTDRDDNLNQIDLADLLDKITLGKLEAVKVKRKAVKVEPGEVDRTLATIQASRAKLIEKDTPAASGDRVEVDFEVSQGGQIIDGGVSSNHPLVIGGESFIPGFEEQLVGMKKGEQKTFSLTAPQGYGRKEIAGKKLDFKVKVVDVKQVQKPELTDEFVRSLGRFQNLEQLVLNVKEGLIQEKEQKEIERACLEALSQIIKAARISLPEAMVNQQLDLMIQSLDADLHGHDMELSLYLAQAGKTEDDLKKEWRPEAERQVKAALVIYKIGREKQIKVEPEEVETELSNLVEAAALQNPGSEASLDLEALRSRILNQIMSRKTLEFIERVCVE